MAYQLTKIRQYFDDDVRGDVPFRDTRANEHTKKAKPSDIRLLIKVRPEERRLLRKAIANDINQPEDRRQ